MSTHQPNVVLILADQLRRAAVGVAGDANVSTPNIDTLAADGVRFSNACATYPVCVPTRFSLMTGEYAHSRGVPAIDYQLSPAETTIADVFDEAGYQTAYIGKWHLAGHHAYRYESGTDIARDLNRKAIRPAVRGGFDYWRGFELRNGPFDTVYFADDDPTPRPIEGYQTDGLFDLACEFLDEREDDRPYFLVISVEPPHPPLVAPSPDLERWQDRPVEPRPNVPLGNEERLPSGYRSWGSTQTGTAAVTEDPYARDTVLDDLRKYYAMIENLDRNVGQFTNELIARGIREESALAFLSDHGELLGSHGLRGKQHPFEESVGVPFIVSYPDGGIDGGRVIEEPTNTEDWYPTLLGLAGMEADEKPGVDLTPVMRGEQSDLDREGVLLEFVREDRPNAPYNDETWRAYRTVDYKYVVKGGIRGGEPWQLFDLAADPYERRNLVDDPAYANVATRMHGLLLATLERTADDYRLKPAFGHDGYLV